MHTNAFSEKVAEIVNDYMTAYQVPYGDLLELDTAERYDLLNTLMEELNIGLDPNELRNLVEKPELSLEDIISSLESGEPMEDDF